jgi:hypothetical protein
MPHHDTFWRDILARSCLTFLAIVVANAESYAMLSAPFRTYAPTRLNAEMMT